MNFQNVDLFNQIIVDCCLRNLGYEGYKYTWSNKSKYPETVEQRLDRYMATDVWMNCWKEVRVFPLARYTYI